MAESMPFSEEEVRVLASDKSFDRGYQYYQNGAVFEVTKRGNIVTARVEGSDYEPYRVQVTLHDSGIANAECTCPYDWGGICKHIVATLLVLLHDRDEIEDKPEIATMLADLTVGQLRQVLLGLAEEGSEFINAIEREVKWLQNQAAPADVAQSTDIEVDINSVRREIHKDFRQAGMRRPSYGYYDEYDGMEFDPDLILLPHLEKVTDLLDAEDVDSAATLIKAIIEAYIDGLTDLDDWIYEYNEEIISETKIDLGAALTEVLLSMEVSPADQEKWLELIADWEEALEDLDIAKTAMEQGWTYPPLVAAMQGNITEKGAWESEAPYYADELALARLRILERQGRTQEYINLATAEGQLDLSIYMLTQSGDIEKAVTEAKTYLSDPIKLVSLAKLLVDKGELAAALDIAEFGLSLEFDFGKLELARWTRDQASAVGGGSLALKAAQVAFAYSYDLADYTAVRHLAGNEWTTIKPRLMQDLEQCWSAMKKIEIYLHENMLIEAMKVLDNQGYPNDEELRQVIKATREKYPDWGIRHCQRKAERIMNAGESGRYDLAINWLVMARGIYEEHERLSEWQIYLDKLLETHHRKYKLVPMLQSIH